MQLSNIARIWAFAASARVVVARTEVGETDVGADVNDDEMDGDGEEYEVVGDNLVVSYFVYNF